MNNLLEKNKVWCFKLKIYMNMFKKGMHEIHMIHEQESYSNPHCHMHINVYWLIQYHEHRYMYICKKLAKRQYKTHYENSNYTYFLNTFDQCSPKCSPVHSSVHRNYFLLCTKIFISMKNICLVIIYSTFIFA